MIAAAVLAFLIQAQPPARDTRPVAATATGAIGGVVVTDELQPRPLRRARVSLSGPALDIPRSVVTSDDGSFAFNRVPPGRFTVSAAKNAYLAMNYGAARTGQPGTNVEVGERQSVSLTLRLPRGAVVTGTVTDVDGLPAAGVAVAVLARRYVPAQGDARYVFAGTPLTAVTDDRGIYRIYGLPAADYVVAAQPSARPGGPGAGEVRTLSRGAISDRGLAMAQVFHPGATALERAARITLRAGEERSGIDIQLQYVPLASVTGVVPAADGWSPATVVLLRAGEPPGSEFIRTARADGAGQFTIAGVPPGQYRLLAISRTLTAPAPPRPLSIPPSGIQTASAEVGVAGEDITNLSLALQPGLTIAGRVVFEGERPPPPLVNVGLALPLEFTLSNFISATPRVSFETGGSFKVEGLLPGAYRIVSALHGVRTPIGAWWLKSIAVGGRELLDAAIDLRESADDAVVTLSDRASEISGTLTDAAGRPAPERWVVVFSVDRSFWFPNSRRIAGIRTDGAGRYLVRNLPPGQYLIAATDDLTPGEWFDSSILERLLSSAAAIIVTGAERTTQDLVIRK